LGRLVKQVRFTRGISKHPFDLYHEPNFLPLSYETPVVTTVHDLSCFRYPEMQPAPRVKLIQRYLPRALERSTRILVDSDFVGQEVIECFGVAPERVITVPLGIASAFRPRTYDETRPHLTPYSLQHGRYLLAVGTLEPRKNLALVFRAYRRLPQRIKRDYPLVIAGMSGWHTEVLRSELHDLSARGHLRLLGYVPEEALTALYSGAAMLLYPSFYEGFGLPPLEAMASGIPVITSNRASLPEVVGNAGWMVEPEDEIALCETMVAVLEGSEETRGRVRLGLERAQRFTWKRCAQETLKAYRVALRS
jgi:alpha-1,3-rhamnosyl/mannosyltransferase